VGRTLGANRLLAGFACGERQCGRPLNSVVRLHVGIIGAALICIAITLGIVGGYVLIARNCDRRGAPWPRQSEMLKHLNGAERLMLCALYVLVIALAIAGAILAETSRAI
jgi:cytochrome b561